MANTLSPYNKHTIIGCMFTSNSTVKYDSMYFWSLGHMLRQFGDNRMHDSLGVTITMSCHKKR